MDYWKRDLNKMKILFIVTELNSANGICSQAVMCELIKQGHSVYCVTNSEHIPPSDLDGIKYSLVRPRLVYRLFQKANLSSNLLIKLIWQFIATVLNKLKLLLSIPTWPLISPSYTGRIYKISQKICEDENVDVVIPVYSQIDTVITAEKIKKRYPSIRYIPYFLDSLSGGYGPKCFSKKWVIHRGLKWEQRLLVNADKIIMMQSSREHHRKYSRDKSYYERILYLDLPLLTIFPKSYRNIDWLPNDKINLLYIGTIPVHIRNPKYFLEVFNAIPNSNFRLTIVGTSTCPAILEEACRGDGRIFLRPSVSHTEAVAAMQTADILVNFGNNKSSMTPSKIFEYMSAQKPIISTAPIIDEPSLPYLKNYPCSLVINEYCETKASVAIRLQEFIKKNKGIKIDATKLKEKSYLNTPQAFVDCISKLQDR